VVHVYLNSILPHLTMLFWAQFCTWDYWFTFRSFWYWNKTANKWIPWGGYLHVLVITMLGHYVTWALV